jgi:hypothetical protein
MAFQFECPNGHLLQGEESHAGQAIPCPVCQVLFLIPAPVAAAAPPASNMMFAPRDGAGGAPAFVADAPAEPEILHIPCPRGHELEVPPDMLDTEVLCPQCNEQFVLLAANSVEHKRRKEMQAQLREERAGKFYLNFAITMAVLVGLLLVSLMVMSSMNQKPVAPPPPAAPPAAKPTPPAPPPVEELRPQLESSPPKS